jgi:squalene synthase HpnC
MVKTNRAALPASKQPGLSSDNAPVNRAAASYRPPSEHYENFPVASWLCPPALRPPIAAIYWFARTADDLADEGDAAPTQRLADLARYRDDLVAAALGQAHSGRWPDVFDALTTMIARFELPTGLLANLLDAFEQDVAFTAAGRRYQTDLELHDYCRRSADPVGRLLLHLYRVRDPQSLAQSDQICTALQLINFWQDLRGDLARARWYPTLEQMTRHGVTDADLRPDSDSARARDMMAAYAAAAHSMMLRGAPLADRIPGRGGWELRLVILGGLRILEKMANMQYATWHQRPHLVKHDLALLAWRALRRELPRQPEMSP